MGRAGWTELRWVPSGGLKVGEDVGSQGRGNLNGKMCRWDRFITMHVDLVPDSELIACHVIRGAYASQRRDSTGASVIEMCVPQ